MGLLTTLIVGGVINNAVDKITDAVSNSQSGQSKARKGKKIALNYNFSEFVGDDPHEVRQELSENGFRDITLEPIPLCYLKKSGIVANVNINGNSSYRQGDKIYNNEEIVIEYYSSNIPTNQNNPLIIFPYDISYIKRMNYLNIKNDLINHGFRNVSLIPVYTESWLTSHRIDKVKKVVVGGRSNIERDVAVYANDRVEIYFYTNIRSIPNDINSIECPVCSMLNRNDNMYCVKCGKQLKKQIVIKRKNCLCCGAPFNIDENKRLYICEYCGNTEIVTNLDCVEID